MRFDEQKYILINRNIGEFQRGIMMQNMTATAIFCGLVFCVSASAQQTTTKPKELEVLSRYVGDWTSEVTNKASVWNADEQKLKTANHVPSLSLMVGYSNTLK